ncbi:MAG: protein-glutamate O-methyltransferase CheR [Candidatus Cloacimonetes bacterium]|nr:protein-glutamate O-methyltransferase CheR [Candidatus Cloacimonadota bacterium]
MIFDSPDDTNFFSDLVVEPVTEKEFQLFSKLIYDKTGINLHIGKKQLLESRLSKVLRKRKLKNFTEYYKIVTADKSGEELMILINLVSTNTTHFFREISHFDFMREAFPFVFGANPDRIDGWCSASSTGEEPYSILMTLAELFDIKRIKINLLASDIDTEVLAKARRGIYSKKNIENIPADIQRKYFKKGYSSADGYYKVKKELIDLITWKKINLIEPIPIAATYHFIFCRNVMIYFDKNIKSRVINALYEHLKPEGYLFVGHSESLSGIEHKFKYIKPAIYQKL